LDNRTYLYTFEGCTGDSPLLLENIAAASDVEVVSLIKLDLEGSEVPTGICRVMDVRIQANDPDSI